jgi:NADPH-dependent 2,4-dienoyl-CoA reductase/sulfur reductase-like enzyme
MVEADATLVTPAGRQRYDSAVLATGTVPVSAPFPGSRTRGVHFLGDPTGFSELREASLGCSRAVLAGCGFTAISVAEALARSGVRVSISAPMGLLPSHFCLCVREAVCAAAEELGISVLRMPLLRAMGSARVEAALVGGEVVPCDAVGVIPRRAPVLPEVGAETGASGRMVVDQRMSTSSPALYAAGSCAECRDGGLPAATGMPPVASGGIAGSNAAGGRASMSPTHLFSRRALGLSVVTSGLALEEARGAGHEALESSSARGERSACSIVFEAGTGAVLGMQYAGPSGAHAPEFFALAVSRAVPIGELAGLRRLGSTDISPVFEAASEGMRLWRRS